MTITKMVWENQTNTVAYKLDDKLYCNVIKELQPYPEQEEETMGKIESFEILESHCADEVKIEFDPSKYEIVKRDNGYFVVKKQPQYPKTYEKCCRVLDIEPYGRSDGYKSELITAFRNLLICRDAYWKIAGDWKPTWSGKDGIKYGICVDCNSIKSCTRLINNIILIFPTEEMRDAFYENFRDLIDECKELL